MKPTIRMSGSGICPRAISAQLLGYSASEMPPWLALAANEGNWHEERIKNELRAEGFTIVGEQNELTLEFPEFYLVGHIDGNVIDPQVNEMSLLEVKSMSQYEFDRWMKGRFAVFPHYAAQITCYMVASNVGKCRYVVRNRNNGYTDTTILTSPPMAMTEIVARVTLATNAALQYELAPAEYNADSIECRRCRYSEHCIPVIEITPQDDQKLSKASEDFRHGKALTEEGDQLVDSARLVFKTHCQAVGLSKLRYNGLSVSLFTQKRTSYDKEMLQNLLTPQQLVSITKITESEQVRITDLEKNND